MIITINYIVLVKLSLIVTFILLLINRQACIRKRGICDLRPQNCCSGLCRCNLLGSNCRCQNRGLFSKLGKRTFNYNNYHPMVNYDYDLDEETWQETINWFWWYNWWQLNNQMDGLKFIISDYILIINQHD